jgi:hypothetical protein
MGKRSSIESERGVPVSRIKFFHEAFAKLVTAICEVLAKSRKLISTLAL